MRTTKKAGTPPKPMPRPWPGGLLAEADSRDHVEALRAWGCRIGLAARDALATGSIERAVGARDRHVAAIAGHYGLTGAHHCLHAEPLAWIRLTETQATRGLMHFLASGEERMRCFLQALAPRLGWPADITALAVETEVPAGRGRIDLLIGGKARGRAWGAVIEAKFEHSLKRNPLGDYMRHGTEELGMALTVVGPGERSGALIVLGKRCCPQTRRILSRNTHWRFVHWHEVLRRFDARLAEPVIDEDFRRFRRTLWERAGGG